MLEQFSATIDKLYAAAADANLWKDALRAVEDYSGSTGAVLNLVPKTADSLPMCLAGSFSQDDCAEYARNYMWRCPRIAFAETNFDVPIHFDRMILSESEMDRDPTYEWYGKHGLRYYVAGWIGETSTHRAYMSLQRSQRQGHVEVEQVHQFSLVLQHMARALSLAAKLGTLERCESLNRALIDALPQAIFVLDEHGRVMFTNSVAERMLVRADAISLSHHKLHCRFSCDQARLEHAIQSAIAPTALEPRGGWARIHSGSGQKTLAVFIAPIISCGILFASLEARALLIITDPTETAFADERALHDLFGLTPAEARLTSALSAGHSIESTAALLRITQATARSELKSVFRKTGFSRQQDLVRMLASLSLTGSIQLHVKE
jgi:DNA-binding CsgD family transcriptional regulator/PAS domain-containing protein